MKATRILMAVMFFLLYAGMGASEETPAEKKKTYLCAFTSDRMKIDGKLDEPAWQKAAVLSFYVPVTGEKAVSQTEAKLLWGEKYLYVGFKAYDKDVWSYLKKRDSATCREDVLEVFVKPHPDKDPYFNFEINALGTIYDAFVVKRGAGGRRWSRWNCKGLKVKTRTAGTLNKWEDTDEYWVMEVAIPFKSLPVLKGAPPKAGDKWLFHVARYDYSVYLPDGVELSSCAQLSEVNFHRYEDWILLEFAGEQERPGDK